MTSKSERVSWAQEQKVFVVESQESSNEHEIAQKAEKVNGGFILWRSEQCENI